MKIDSWHEFTGDEALLNVFPFFFFLCTPIIPLVDFLVVLREIRRLLPPIASSSSRSSLNPHPLDNS